MSPSQRAMLRMALRFDGRLELGNLVMECAAAYDGPLAWRIADRTAGSLIHRGWLEADDYTVHVTEAGRAALEAVR